MLNFYKSISLKLNKYELKNPFVFFALKLSLLIVVILLLIKIILTTYEIIDMDLSTEMITVLASLLGATVGGVITYITTTGSILKSNRVKSAIINKKTIYEPIYIEFKQLLEDIEQKEIIYISRDSRYRTIGSTSFEFWTRVKNDTRIFQIPDYLNKDIVEMENTLNKYMKQVDYLIDNALEQFESILNANGYQINDNRDGIRSFFKAKKIIHKEKDILLEDFFRNGVFGISKIIEKDKPIINAAFNDYIENNSELANYEFLRNLLVEKLKNCLEVIELIIKTIRNKYERQNNLF
ncbi:hypothetical protein ACOQFO_09035 [Ureibacillus sp. MALMAid1270]|uniref:hypothetical protein n=1 Tax=Ureibacillus sp. MALMAid1270 TaxID=3411629 RepID=UPI003BA54B94